MKVYGLTGEQVASVTRTVSAELYADNIRANITGEDMTRRGPRTRFVLRCDDSRGPGSRLAPSGRHTPAASWGAHKDVLRALFDVGAERIVDEAAVVIRDAVYAARHPEPEPICPIHGDLCVGACTDDLD